MASTVVLITGGNRGLGHGLVKRFLAAPNHTVIAANRDPNHATSKALADLPKGNGSNLIVVKLDAGVEQDPFNAVKELQDKHGIDVLDIVVANAGISLVFPAVKDVKRSDILQHVDVNVFGVLSLYQATRDLLQKSQKKPILAIVGSLAGGLSNQPAIPNAAYGASKALLNWYGVRINAEDEWLNAFVLDPGWVQTDMGNSGAKVFGMESAPVLVDDSVDGLFNVLNTTTKEKHGGKVVSYQSEIQPW